MIIPEINGKIINNKNASVTYNFEPASCSNTNLVTQTGSSTTTNSLLAYPNPTSGEVNVRVPVLKSAKADILISDADGTVVQSRSTNTEGQIEAFDLSDAGPGLYIIKVVSPVAVEHYKIVVQ